MHSCLVGVEARNLTRSSVHRCIRAMSTGKRARSRTARHELLKIMPNTDSAAALVRACLELSCTLRGSAPPRRSVGTCAAGSHTTDLPDVVVSAGEALRSDTAVGEVVSPSRPRDRAADAVGVSSAVTADIAAAAASAMGAAVVAAVAAMRAAAVAAQGASVAGCDLDHPRGASLSVCRGGLAHGLHLQPRFGRRPHEQRLARGLRHSSSLDPTGSSPPEQSHLPGLSNQVHLSLRTNESHREFEELGCSVLYVLSRGRVLLLGVSLV